MDENTRQDLLTEHLDFILFYEGLQVRTPALTRAYRIITMTYKELKNLK